MIPKSTGDLLPGSRACPGDDEIACFLEGNADAAATERLLRHVDHCAPCRSLIATALRASDESTATHLAGGLPLTFPVGEFVAGRYRILQFIARGGMGEVYEAFDTQQDMRVALKTLVCTGSDDIKLLKRIREEVLLAKRVAHPNVCRILEFGLHEHTFRNQRELLPFFTMEFLNGETLAAYSARRGPLPKEKILGFALQIVDALAAIHEAGIVHRDLKPQNVFLATSKAGKPRVVVMDFGLARSTDIPNSNLTTTKGKIVGTPAYMAPEQTQGQKPSTAWDIYSLGVILFQLASGRMPYLGSEGAVIVARRTEKAPRLSSLVPDVGRRVTTIVAKCLELDPAQRFTRVEEIRELIVNPHWQRRTSRTDPTMVLWILLGVAALLVGYWLSRANLRLRW